MKVWDASVARAKSLRRKANPPEQTAWKALRKLRSRGYPVRRQHPIGPYIVDFTIVAAKLVIEIDGTIHRLEEVQMRDNEREKNLNEMGWNVIRFSGDEAFHEDYLLNAVLEHVGE